MTRSTDSSGAARFEEYARGIMRLPDGFDWTKEVVEVLERVRRETIEECAKLCDREARICNGQKSAAKGYAAQVHVGGECIAVSLASQIRALAEFTSDGEK